MIEVPVFLYTLIAVTAITSIRGFTNRAFLERFVFDSQGILAGKEYYRMVTSAFLHGDWMHLAFNLYSLYLFGRTLEVFYGSVQVGLIYFLSVIGGSVLSLAVHRREAYRALGASGGVCGVIFASIFLLPGGHIMAFPLPVWIPAPIYAVAFLVFSFWAMKRGVGNVGHDAHLGGAVVGVIIAVVLEPNVPSESPVLFATVVILAIVGALLLWHPVRWDILVEKATGDRYQSSKRYQRYDENRAKRREVEEIDRILDKISAKGISSLTKRESAALENYRRRVR
jgi:membrane associated rhomboid family serine protease